MTLFTIISIIISTSGVTLTTLTQLRTAFDRYVNDVSQAIDGRCETLVQKMDPKHWLVKVILILTWCSHWAKRAWKFSSVPPILAFGIFAFTIAFVVMQAMDGAVGWVGGAEAIKADAVLLTADWMHCYRKWLGWIIWTDISSLVLMFFSIFFLFFVKVFGGFIFSILMGQKGGFGDIQPAQPKPPPPIAPPGMFDPNPQRGFISDRAAAAAAAAAAASASTARIPMAAPPLTPPAAPKLLLKPPIYPPTSKP